MSQDLLLEEGIMESDAFVALTGKDEQNVLMSVYSQSKGVQKTLTKINRDEIVDISKSLGIETVITLLPSSPAFVDFLPQQPLSANIEQIIATAINISLKNLAILQI